MSSRRRQMGRSSLFISFLPIFFFISDKAIQNGFFHWEKQNHLRYPLEPTEIPYTLKFTLQMILYGILSGIQSACTPAPHSWAPEYAGQCQPLTFLRHTVLTHHSHSSASHGYFWKGWMTLPPYSPVPFDLYGLRSFTAFLVLR